MHRQRELIKKTKKNLENLFLGSENGKRGCRVIVSRLSMITWVSFSEIPIGDQKVWEDQLFLFGNGLAASEAGRERFFSTLVYLFWLLENTLVCRLLLEEQPISCRQLSHTHSYFTWKQMEREKIPSSVFSLGGQLRKSKSLACSPFHVYSPRLLLHAY